MRTKLYYDMRGIDDASFDFASMRKLTRPGNLAGIRRTFVRSATTRMVAHNGGCSTTSGMVPVSVSNVVLLADVAGRRADARIAAREAANDNSTARRVAA